MKVFCPTHKRRFATDAATPIVCEREGGHVLGGAPNDPATKTLWAYCCNCANFMPLGTNGTADSSCLVCDRKITTRFLCERCQTLSFESSESAKNKEFLLTKEGLPKPYCAGCLKSTEGNLREHECESLGVTYITLRSICPFDGEPLSAPPSFPCSVSKLFEDARDSLTTLEFDAESNVLRESSLGNYMLVNQMRNSRLSIVIPKAHRLNTKRDYYDTYYELFNCDNPAPGEVVVLSPAIIEKTENGWQLREAGFIDIKPDPSAQPAVSDPQVKIPCAACGELEDVGHPYCKRCGSPMLGQQRVAAIPPEIAPEVGHDPAHSLDTPKDQFAENLPRTTEEFSARVQSAPAGVPGKALLGGAAALVLVGIVILITALSGSGLLPGSELSVEKKLDRSIAAGHLFGPANDNAHDLYYTLKNSGANDATLGRYREKLTPLLTPHGDQLIGGLMQIGYDEPDFTEWQEATKSLDWAQELNPGNNYIAARAAYCRGRAAYLQKDLDEALKRWTSAADLDKSWVLPLNGLGMVYTAKKNWESARSYFFQALKRDANWPFPEENIGNTYWEQKDYATAKDFYHKAVAKAPDWAKPHVHLAYIAVVENDYATAVTEFEAALSSNTVGLKGKEPAITQKALEKARQKLSEAQGY